jgi:tRNA threonylcarbamoyladenosine biosynthesis protein TsaE
MHVKRTGNTLTVALDSEDETARLGRAIALLVEPGVVIGLVGPWPKHWESIRPRSPAPRLS